MEASRPAGNREELAAAIVLFLVASVGTGFGVRGERVVSFQLGPNDHAYLTGFATHYEIEEGAAYRWTTYDAKVDLPFALEGGPFEISYRFSRVFAETAEVEVLLDERTIDRFSARGGAVATRSAEIPALSSTPLSLRFRVDSHERRTLGLKLDWVSVAAGPAARITPRGIMRWLPAALTLFLYGVFRFGGLGPRPSAAIAAGVLGTGLAFLPRDVFAVTHVLRHVSLTLVLLSIPAAAWLRRREGGAWVVPLFVTAYLIRGAGLFHPETFYLDVENARDYVETFRETSGSLAERGVETQEKTNVGYPRTVAGKDYAFPYSPLYFLPFALAQTPGAIEDAVRLGGLAASVLTILPLFWIASAAFSSRVGVLAALLFSFSPPIFSRLLLALHATVVGNFLDTLVIASILALTLEPESRRRLLAVFGATLTCLLVYTSSLFSMTSAFLFVSLLSRQLALRLLSILLLCGTITVLWLYWPFLAAFFGEILPAMAASGFSRDSAGSGSPLAAALSRVPLFYGYLYPVLALAGLHLARRKADRRAFTVLLAWALAFLFMLSLRAFGGGLFRDLKEITFAAPLTALLTAASLVALSERGRTGRIAAAALVAVLVLFGLARYRGYLELNQSPFTERASRANEEPL
jgi:hypothetical protein